jgi:hypothetical protein
MPSLHLGADVAVGNGRHIPVTLGQADNDSGLILLEGVPEVEVILASLHLARPEETAHYRTDGFHLWWDNYLTSEWHTTYDDHPSGVKEIVDQELLIFDTPYPHEEPDILIGFLCTGCWLQDAVVLINTFAYSHYLHPRGWFSDNKVGSGLLANYPTLMGDRIQIINERRIENISSEHLMQCRQTAFPHEYWMARWKELQDEYRRNTSHWPSSTRVPRDRSIPVDVRPRERR